jgi:hypothetical protein
MVNIFSQLKQLQYETNMPNHDTYVKVNKINISCNHENTFTMKILIITA